MIRSPSGPVAAWESEFVSLFRISLRRSTFSSSLSGRKDVRVCSKLHSGAILISSRRTSSPRVRILLPARKRSSSGRVRILLARSKSSNVLLLLMNLMSALYAVSSSSACSAYQGMLRSECMEESSSTWMAASTDNNIPFLLALLASWLLILPLLRKLMADKVRTTQCPLTLYSCRSSRLLSLNTKRTTLSVKSKQRRV